MYTEPDWVPWRGELAAVIVLVLVATAVVLVQFLAARRVQLDADIIDRHGGQHKPSKPVKSISQHKLYIPKQHTEKGICTVRIYWPAVALSEGPIYGWFVHVDPSELAIVVAGASFGKALAGVPPLTLVGAVNSCEGSTDTPVYLDVDHVDRLSCVPLIRSVNIDDAVPMLTQPHISIVLYHAPNAELLESYDIPQASIGRWTPLEQFVSMDINRWREMSQSPDVMKPGRGLREAISLINAAQHVCCHKSAVRVHSLLSRMAAICRRISALSQRIPKVFMYSAALLLVSSRGQRLGAWSKYNASMLAIYCWTRQDGPRPDILAAQAEADASWDALYVWILDITLGNVLASVLETYVEYFAHLFATAASCINAEAVHSVFKWLASWPLGLKLNTELALFLGDTLGSVASGLSVKVPWNAVSVVHTLCLLSRTLGFCMCLSVASDMVLIGSVHVRVMHALIRHVYCFLMQAAGNLFDVFRGKKRNPLHGGRVDNAQYEVDQLFLGTLLFTLLVFLFPTVLMYYSVCALAQLMVLGIVAMLRTLVAMVDGLPISKLMHSITNPLREPAGLYWTSCTQNSATNTGVRQLKSCPFTVSSILRGYVACFAPLQAFPRLLWAAMCGRPLVL